MNLDDYFKEKKGLGILATADGEGRVNAAVYGRPHFIDGETVAFIMQDRLSHRNLQSNPSAAYLFKEEGEKYVGKRLYLTQTGEEKDSPLIAELKRHKSPEAKATASPASRFLVYFRIDRVLPLIGDGGKKQP
ncbi:MAG: Pyridoxamine 5'-phosphate oxidase [Syntrophaceae bacterium PtaB.Bin095]|jgi:hypothetical protein|nr:MAG: Pyridoxamine 5'-phosphate oxidase [Syntrophaceae bacterium PtaB.Bin095]